MDELLRQAGLNESQAQTYLYLLDHGEASPPTIAEAMDLTRSNAYKILDKLVELSLINRTEVNKKFVYKATDPIALAHFITAEKHRIAAMEKGLRDSMPDLRKKYQRNNSSTEISTHAGNAAIAGLYKQHFSARKPTYSLHGDVENPIVHIAPVNTRHAVALSPEDYTAPVEWSVSGDEVLIISFEHEASAVRIKNAVVAKAFQELWQLLDNSIRRDPQYKKLPKLAKRKV